MNQRNYELETRQKWERQEVEREKTNLAIESLVTETLSDFGKWQAFVETTELLASEELDRELWLAARDVPNRLELFLEEQLTEWAEREVAEHGYYHS